MRIAVIEDNKKIATYIKQSLKEAGYVVDVAHDGNTGQKMIERAVYDVAILDIMLPEKDGITVCKNIRNQGNVTPIILVTAKDTLQDKIQGIDSGADDYIVKPFAVEELLARVRMILRRPTSFTHDVLQVQDVIMDIQKHTVTIDDKNISLTQKEFVILEYLLRNAGVVISREQLLEHCWDFAYDAFSNITDVYIKQLRKKLHDSNEKYIKTIRGTGYTFQI